MDRLCDEIIQLIMYQLEDPTPLTLTSQRYYNISKDPYVRAHYFLARHGPTEAMFWALGRGALLDARTLDILIGSGAHLSRYLCQVAMNHFFRSHAHPFIKTHWVRSIPLPVFTHFMQHAVTLYGDIPRGKGMDDGSLFASFLKERREEGNKDKHMSWEVVREVVERFRFIPFSHKDPLMAQFPLALAIEPRLLPLAAANGFVMDSKYRDFIFRKMFEHLPSPNGNLDKDPEEIVRHVQELSRLDPSMYLSRTVAAEICIEAKQNMPGYVALKKLHRLHELRFDLPKMVNQLIEAFLNSRRLCINSCCANLRLLYKDFPTSSPTARLVILLTFFYPNITSLNHTSSGSSSQPTVSSSGSGPQDAINSALTKSVTTFARSNLREQLQQAGLTPSRGDVINVLLHPLIEKPLPVLVYWRDKLVEEDGEDADADVDLKIRKMAEEIAVRCLGLGFKGKTLRKLCETFSLVPHITEAVLSRYRIEELMLPPWENEAECWGYQAELARDYGDRKIEYMSIDDAEESEDEDRAEAEAEAEGEEGGEAEEDEVVEAHEVEVEDIDGDQISLDSLSDVLSREERVGMRHTRRRWLICGGYDSAPYSREHLNVSHWIKSKFSEYSPVTALFLTHALINNNVPIVNRYLSGSDLGYMAYKNASGKLVPITLNHFKLLGRLGKVPPYQMFVAIEWGAEFYRSEEDYVNQPCIKVEHTTPPPGSMSARTNGGTQPSSSNDEKHTNAEASTSTSISSSSGTNKRPRRRAAQLTSSYVVPNSDDEMIVDHDHTPLTSDYDNEGVFSSFQKVWKPVSEKVTRERKEKEDEMRMKKERAVRMQTWVRELTGLQKEEGRKLRQKKKQLEMEAPEGTKIRVPKSEFYKNLNTNIRHLRKLAEQRWVDAFGNDPATGDEYSDDEDDYAKPRTTKRKKTGKEPVHR